MVRATREALADTDEKLGLEKSARLEAERKLEEAKHDLCEAERKLILLKQLCSEE